ncbi:nuclear transport factor 2 family protein [bacterium]|nr:nuclear transport factor 2 family protein [bacterium]
MSTKDEVMQAHKRFYEALNRVVNLDASLMPDVWHHDETVTTVHPLGHWAIGWDEVHATWIELGNVLSDGKVTVDNLNISVLGDVAYTTGVEHVIFTLVGQKLDFKSNTTNIYRRTQDGWKIIHHHADKAPEAEKATKA